MNTFGGVGVSSFEYSTTIEFSKNKFKLYIYIFIIYNKQRVFSNEPPKFRMTQITITKKKIIIIIN